MINPPLSSCADKSSFFGDPDSFFVKNRQKCLDIQETQKIEVPE
jgi:hypothetical protein